MDITTEERTHGVAIGAAFGDALGAATEFLRLPEIHQKFGKHGIQYPASAFGVSPPVVTDDTQMATATARGLTEAQGYEDALEWIWRKYQVWYELQKNSAFRRGPGHTCMSALRGGIPGGVSHPINQSAGCGGIMRVYPVGIAYMRKPEEAFEMGIQSAALTHGHPNAYVPSGFFAELIANLLRGKEISEALEEGECRLEKLNGEKSEGTKDAVRIAQVFARKDLSDEADTIDQSVGQQSEHGGGWQGHDALSIAIFAVLRSANDPLRAVRVAANHSGDTDSTSALAGAIMGAIHGPDVFLNALTLVGQCLKERHELEALADNLKHRSERGELHRRT